jgi:hypothetical protein
MAHQESTENGMHANHIREECRAKQNNNDRSHEEHTGSILDGSGSPRKPVYHKLQGEKNKERPAEANKEDVECCETTTTIDQPNG